MPYGSIRIGEHEITALRDVLTDVPGTLAEWFPGVPEDQWAMVEARYPDTIAVGGGWRYHVYSYLIRGRGRIFLVDSGIGPTGTPISGWLHPPGGSLPEELASAGVAPDAVHMVVTTHMHIDHIGWNVTEAGPFFSNARYLIQEADWIAYADEQDEESRAERDRLVRSLHADGVLELVEGERELAEGLRLVPTPGHTPGSQSVLVTAGERGLLVGGDIANHPVQVEQPEWHSGGDADPQAAARTRREWFDRLERDGMLLATAHFPDPFGRVTEGRWEPLQQDERPMPA